MIDLKRNSKGELVAAKGYRVRSNTIYKPGQKDDFKISRSKFEDFLKCNRCFYLDRVKGLDRPQGPPFKLNEATDTLFKKEFDKCREEKKPHRIFKDQKLNHIIPFQHKDIEKWRDSLHAGLSARYKETNIILSGGIDDALINTKNNKIVVVDYKSQAKKKEALNTRVYLDDVFHQSYKNQLDFYAYLFTLMNFPVDDTGYFIVCNADKDQDDFKKIMKFDELLVPYKWVYNWIPNKIDEMIKLLNSKSVPDYTSHCKNCAYDRQTKNL